MGLKELRLRALLSREELAEKMGVSRAAISLWELGKATPRMEHIRKLIQILGVDVQTLFDALEEDKRGEKELAAVG